MAFYNPVTVELFDADDNIIMPVTAPISITNNIQAFDFNYIAVQVETYDTVMREVLQRWSNLELIQYRVTGRWGVETGDLNSVYAYDQEGSGEFSFYGRSHKEIFNNVLGFIDPAVNAVQRTYAETHKRYKGSALKVVRDVLTDNFVNRIGQPMVFPSGDLGNEVDIDFRFDELHKHLWLDGEDRGGAQLGEKGNIIFDIHRDFAKHRYVLTAREPVHHEQRVEVRSGLINRWQITSNRGEASRVIVGGPREMADRVFGSTEADETQAPTELAVAKADKALIESRIKQLAKDRDSAKNSERKASSTRRQKLKNTLSKAQSAAQKKYVAAVNKAKKDYKAALAKAKNDSDRRSAKYTYDSDLRSAESTRKSERDSAMRTYKEDLKDENKDLSTNLKTADLQYKTDVATQKDLLKTLLKQWPFPHRMFPAEFYTEDTNPEGIKSEDMNPSDPQEKLKTIAKIADELDKVAVTKRTENGPFVTVSGELVESDNFYLGEHIAPGDYVMIGIDEHITIGEQQIEKVIITWSKEDGYKVQLTKPDDEETTDEETLKRIIGELRELSTKTGRR